MTDNQYCFVCGEQNPAGLRLTPVMDRSRHSASCEARIPAEYQGWSGIVHGGMIAALLDEVTAYAAMTVSARVVTAELNIRYLKPLPVDHDVVASAQLRERVGRSLFIDSRLTCEGQLMATAEARMVILRNGPVDKVQAP